MIEGARELCGVATAGQLGFLQPLAETFKSMNADKNIEGLMAAAAGEWLRTEGERQIKLFGRKMIKTIHNQRLPTGERVC